MNRQPNWVPGHIPSMHIGGCGNSLKDDVKGQHVMLSKFKNKARVKELLEMANNVYYYKL